MKKKILAIVLEAIPIVSAPLAFSLIRSSLDSSLVRGVICVAMALAFLGVAFFFIGRALAKKDKVVLILGILDIAATVSVIGFYILVIFLFAL